MRRQIRGAKADAVPNSVLSSLAEFDDYFAGKEQGRAETLRSKLLIEAGIPVTSEQVREAFERSRDFAKLGASRYVGGVVIGREPEDGAPPDITGFVWSEDPAFRFESKLDPS